MAVKSTAERYAGFAILLHWTTALAVLGLLSTGLLLDEIDEGAGQLVLLRIHVALGLSVLVLTVLRLAWFWLFDRWPREPAGTPRLQALAARIVHGLFYVVIFVMAASGIGMLALSGIGPALFGGTPALPDFSDYPPRDAHETGSVVMMALIAVHVGAALYHQFVLRDRLLARMGIGR